MRVVRTVMVSLLPTLLLLATLAAPAGALEPPRPGELARLERQGKLGEALRRAEALGNYKVAPGLVQSARARLERAALGLAPLDLPPVAWRGLPTKGTVKIPALLISFSDYAPTVSAQTYQSMLFGSGDPAQKPYESLHDYYLRSSYGQLDIQGTVLGWYHTGQPRSAVAETDAGREALIKQALQSYDATTDFSQFDNNGDGTIDYLIVVWTGPQGAFASFWWGYQTHWQTDPGFRLDGKALAQYSWQRQASNPRVTIHETGHALGLPDLYDYNPSVGPSGGVGGLDMMDGNWGDHNGFSKWVLDWLAPQVCSGAPGGYTLAPSGTDPDALIVMPGASARDPFKEYFLVQDRSRVGNDSGFPTDGLLVWHIDATLDGTGENYAFNNSNTSHKLVRLMEADGLEEIEKGSPANAGDFYEPGGSLGPATTPNSTAYSGAKTGVSVTQIARTGDGLHFTAALVPFPTSSSSYAFAADAASGWLNAAQTVPITASGGDGSGRTIHFSTDGGATWGSQAGDSVSVPVTAEGAHHILFYASDSATAEPAHDAGYVNIDTRAPVARANNVSARRGRPVTLSFRIDDATPGCGSAYVTLVIKKGRWALQTSYVGLRPTNAPLTYVYSAGLARGTYSYAITAVDLAWNATAKAGAAKLIVR